MYCTRLDCSLIYTWALHKVYSMLLRFDSSWTAYQIPNLVFSARKLKSSRLHYHEYKDKAMTMLATKAFTSTVVYLFFPWLMQVTYLCTSYKMAVFMYCYISSEAFMPYWNIEQTTQTMAKAGKCLSLAWMRSNCNQDNPSWTKSTSDFFLKSLCG